MIFVNNINYLLIIYDKAAGAQRPSRLFVGYIHFITPFAFARVCVCVCVCERA